MPQKRRIPPVRRRRIVQALALGGLGTLAGCIGDDDDDDDDTDDTDDVDDGDDTDAVDYEHVPRQLIHPNGARGDSFHGNPWEDVDYFGRLTAYMLFYNPILDTYVTGEQANYLADEWSVDGTTATVTLRDDYTWHDGEPVTAYDADVAHGIEWEIQRIENPDDDPHTIVEDWDVVDDQTIEYDLRHSWTPSLVAREIWQWWQDPVPDQYFRHWYDQLLDRTDREAGEEILDDFYAWDGDDDDGWGEIPVGNSAFKISRFGENTVFTEPHEGHPNYEHINWDGIVFTEFPDRQIAYLEERLHVDSEGHPVDPDLEDQLPENHMLFNNGFFVHEHIVFNGGQDLPREPEEHPTHDPRVRRALAFVMDKELMARNRGPHMRANDHAPVYMPFPTLDQGLIDLDGFESYDQDWDRAAEILEDIGYQEDDGEWYAPDGSRFELNCIGAAWFEAIETAADDFEEFGIDVTLENLGWAEFSERRVDGDYDCLIDATHADDPFNIWTESYMVDWMFQSLGHQPLTWEIPMPVGDPTGSLEEVNLLDEIVRVRELDDDDEIWEQFRLLAWAWNQWLPQYDTHAGPHFAGFNADGFDVLEQDSGKMASRHTIWHILEQPDPTGSDGHLGIKAVEEGLLGHEDGVQPWV